VAEGHARHLVHEAPAMNATIGSRELFSLTQADSCASMRPPGSV
jgi:hypothetical protein